MAKSIQICTCAHWQTCRTQSNNRMTDRIREWERSCERPVLLNKSHRIHLFSDWYAQENERLEKKWIFQAMDTSDEFEISAGRQVTSTEPYQVHTDWRYPTDDSRLRSLRRCSEMFSLFSPSMPRRDVLTVTNHPRSFADLVVNAFGIGHDRQTGCILMLSHRSERVGGRWMGEAGKDLRMRCGRIKHSG